MYSEYSSRMFGYKLDPLYPLIHQTEFVLKLNRKLGDFPSVLSNLLSFSLEIENEGDSE